MERQCVVAFATTTDALLFETEARQAGLGGRLIPMPRQISADCGLAWRENPEERETVEKLLAEHSLHCERIVELLI
jgi:hypothetical protein